MLWVKAFHIVFVASWFAGLFYLPRILVNLAMVPANSEQERARLLLMAGKLLRFSNMLAVAALAFGVWLWGWYGFEFAQGMGWLHAKLFLVALVVVYHVGCARLLHKFEAGLNSHGHVWYRWFNEIPVVLLVAIVVLVVVKPF